MVNFAVAKCWYCECEIFENGDYSSPVRAVMDHKVPRSKGGAWLAHNTVPACNTCNQFKGVSTTQELLAALFLGYCEAAHAREVVRALREQRKFLHSSSKMMTVTPPIF